MTSLPALKAAKSISPGALKLEAPFIVNASVKIKPLKPKRSFKIDVTMFSDNVEG